MKSARDTACTRREQAIMAARDVDIRLIMYDCINVKGEPIGSRTVAPKSPFNGSCNLYCHDGGCEQCLVVVEVFDR